MLTLEQKSLSASGMSTMPMEIGMTGRPGSNMSTRFANSNPSGCDGIPGLVAGTAVAI